VNIIKKVTKYFIVLLIFIILIYSKLGYSKKKQTILINDYEIEKFINELIYPIVNSSNLNLKEPYFLLTLDKTPNAYTNETEQLFINTGLITFIKNPESLIGVIAHEIAHITARHVSKRRSNIDKKKEWFEISNVLSLSAAVLAKNSDIFLGSNLASSQLIKTNISQYSKNQEREADKIAIEYLERAQITTSGLLDLLESLQIANEKKGIKADKFNNLTHPFKSERIAYIKKFRRNLKHNSSFYNKKIHERFRFIKAKIIGYTYELEDVKSIYSKNNSVEKKYALSIAYARNGFINKSIENINDLIIKFPNNPYFYETKGEILLNFGYVSESNQFFKKSLNIDESNDYIRLKLIKNLSKNIKNEDDAEKIMIQISKFKLDIWKNNEILNLQLKISEYLNQEDLFYESLAYIEIKKGNLDLAKKYFEYVIEITDNRERAESSKKNLDLLNK
tara:strand:- start:7052 stop:8401 length:1350 start_codon:yes stop_codon:yes gene_type:complete